MHSEIGGYFELESYHSNYLHQNLLSLNSGRNCLKYLIRHRKIRKILIPDYICDAVEQACYQSNVEVIRYEIGTGFLPNSQIIPQEDEYFYLVDYFGQLDKSFIDHYKNLFSGRIIIDAAQCYFRKYSFDLDVIYTCRKFFGVPDGAFLQLKNGEVNDLTNIEKDNSGARMEHLIGRLEYNASSYYEKYQKNEDLFYSLPVKKMSNLTRAILSSINYATVQKTRENNFAYLDELLKDFNKLTVNCPNGPYAYPFMTDRESAEIVRKKLIENKVFVPILWPNVLKNVPNYKQAFKYSWSIIPLPIDQRYGKEEMEFIYDLISGIELL